jgi:hypothetical protein
MSRFDAERWDRIVIWSAAALAWGTAVIATTLQPEEPAPAVGEAADHSRAAMPRPTSEGLVIIRYTQDESSGFPSVSTADPAPRSVSVQAAPEPTSSGS